MARASHRIESADDRVIAYSVAEIRSQGRDEFITFTHWLEIFKSLNKHISTTGLGASSHWHCMHWHSLSIWTDLRLGSCLIDKKIKACNYGLNYWQLLSWVCRTKRKENPPSVLLTSIKTRMIWCRSINVLLHLIVFLGRETEGRGFHTGGGDYCVRHRSTACTHTNWGGILLTMWVYVTLKQLQAL